MQNILERKEWPKSASGCVCKQVHSGIKSPLGPWFQSSLWTGLNETIFTLWDGDLTVAGSFSEKLPFSNEQKLFLSILAQCEVYFFCQCCQTLTCSTAPNNSTHAWSLTSASFPLTDHGDCPLEQPPWKRIRRKRFQIYASICHF